jgi:hypothetical protein
MGAVVRQVTALVVTLLLALGAPLSTPRSCDRCPVGCPMHREGGGERRMGCHHGKTAASEDGAVLKCACGHQRVATPAATEYGILPRTAAIGALFAGAPLAEVPSVSVSRGAPEPPAEPPRFRVV